MHSGDDDKAVSEFMSGSVEVLVDSDPSLVATVRTVAADLAGRADFDLDAIADLRMAVDESCAALLVLANSRAPLCCRFTLERAAIHARISVQPAQRNARVPTSGFGWQVLSVLVEQLHAHSSADSSSGTGAGPPAQAPAHGECELVISWIKHQHAS
jgi:serine/threonine-protein kinase RsbW